MARRVNPNRMELMRLRNQLKVARRGHKLLKDKRDEMMRQFLELVQENLVLRERAESHLRRANAEMMLARAVMPQEQIQTALMSGRGDLSLEMREENVMSVRVPVFSLPRKAVEDEEDKFIDPEEKDESSLRLPYALSSASGELDQAVLALKEALPVLLDLASAEKKTQLLADEIEKTRRRVNSLEYRLIPELEATIHNISMKMDEAERGNLTRLMKVKDLIVEQEIRAKQRLAEAASR